MREQGPLPPHLDKRGDNLFDLFPGIDEEDEINYGQEYAQARAGEVIEACLRFGLNGEFVPIFARYLTDLYLVELKRAKPPVDGVMVDLRKEINGDNHPWSRYLVMDEDDITRRIKDINEFAKLDISSEVPVGVEQGLKYARFVSIIRRTTEEYEDLKDLKYPEDMEDMEDTGDPDDLEDLKDQEYPEYPEVPEAPKVPVVPLPSKTNYGKVIINRDDTTTSSKVEMVLSEDAKANLMRLKLVAIDWIFYEQTMVVLSESCFMRNVFERYIPGINIRNLARGHLAISATYLSTNYSPDNAPNASEDMHALMSGFGLMMLYESLLKFRITNDYTLARWIIEKLKKKTGALDTEAVEVRIKGMAPKTGVLQGYASLSDAVYDPSLVGVELGILDPSLAPEADLYDPSKLDKESDPENDDDCFKA